MKKKVVRLNFYGVRLPGVIGIASTRTTGDWPADARAPTRTTGECGSPLPGPLPARPHVKVVIVTALVAISENSYVAISNCSRGSNNVSVCRSITSKISSKSIERVVVK